MPIQIVRNDITKIQCDAIVNPTDRVYSGRAGVDGAIHRAAGWKLRWACRKLGSGEVGGAQITPGYKLPCRYIIHTVGPYWKNGQHGEKEQLISCYQNALRLAQEYQCESIAVPLISSGTFGYPKDEAMYIAMTTIEDFLFDHEMLVYLVVYDKESYQISKELFDDVKTYIDDRYVGEQKRTFPEIRAKQTFVSQQMSVPMMESSDDYFEQEDDDKVLLAPQVKPLAEPIDFTQMLNETRVMLDESFSQMLLRKIDEKGMTDAQCYKKANIDRKLFSKIRSDIHYRPSKITAISFAIALELSMEETDDLLRKAGFALSHSNYFDIIIEYFIQRGIYNVMRINEVLFAFDQNLLGG